MDGSPCPTVHAAFYLWYGTPQADGLWKHWDHATIPHWTAKMNRRFPPGVRHHPLDAPHSPFYPARGLYSSSDAAVLDVQLRELAQAGVDSVMLSWWGRRDANVTRDSQGVSTDERVPAVLDAAARAGIGVSWHLEPYGGRSPSSILDDLRYLAQTYGRHPAVWRRAPASGGPPRPLVFLYDVSHEHSGHDATSREAALPEWRRVLALLRGSDADATLLSLYIDQRDDAFLTETGIDGAYTVSPFALHMSYHPYTTDHFPVPFLVSSVLCGGRLHPRRHNNRLARCGLPPGRAGEAVRPLRRSRLR
jgi:glycoprotein endo-alpha-1,2-mannosidase